MNNLSAYINQINALCYNHKVKSLYAFGSVLTSNFTPTSDIDLIVDFKEVELNEYADNYFDFKFSLQDLLKHPVDLLEEHTIKIPILSKWLIKQRSLFMEVETIPCWVNK